MTTLPSSALVTGRSTPTAQYSELTTDDGRVVGAFVPYDRDAYEVLNAKAAWLATPSPEPIEQILQRVSSSMSVTADEAQRLQAYFEAETLSRLDVTVPT
jgi:hypothetical protein